jgi:phosphoserine phosphatase RsbU/P
MPGTTESTVAGGDDRSRTQEVRDLQVILDIARAMAASMDVDKLLEMILNSVRQLLNADRASLFLYDPATDELHSKIAHGAGEIRFPATAGIAGAAARDRKVINIPDAYADPRFNRDIDRQTGYVTRCLLTVPLEGTDGHLTGVVQAINKVGGVFTAYDERLAEALAAQVGVTLQRARLMRHYVEKKQLESSLAIARGIQQALLPKSAPVIAGYDIAGWNQPADETGGDCYDYIPLDDGRLALQVADASGHGIGAALVISEMRALLRAFSGQAVESVEVLSRANRCLCDDLPPGRFVTVFFGILDPVRHRLDYASAGHGPLFWYKAATGEVTCTGGTGVPLGMLDPIAIDPAPSIEFAPGDIGVLLTDGIVEAENPQGDAFGKERVTQVICENAASGPADIIRVLQKNVHDFIAGGPQLDDLTLVVVKRRPA